MKVAVLGTGEVGRTLGKAFVDLGHEVRLGSRSATNAKAVAWVKEAGDRGAAATYADAASWADLIVLATLGTANAMVIRAAGPAGFAGKIVIDATNPLDFGSGKPALALGFSESGGEQVQELLPDAKVVKAFNSVGNALMFKPDLPGGPPDMFICGNDDGAKQEVTRLLTDFGWGAVDIGGIEGSRYLEPLALLWVLRGVTSGKWKHAFKLLVG